MCMETIRYSKKYGSMFYAHDVIFICIVSQYSTNTYKIIQKVPLKFKRQIY
uniref:Uncharacterized protein n=1 Tax=Arundo donax TaxID=35708 RepID=A0A0A9ABE1_ARUDO